LQVNPYLLFSGNCAEALQFYEDILGGKIVSLITHRETPMAGHVSPEWQDKVIHARMTIGDTILMASDAPPEYYHTPGGFSVSLLVDSAEEAERVFAALSDGGEVRMPISETFWAVRFGMCTDKFGIPWMVNFQKPMP